MPKDDINIDPKDTRPNYKIISGLTDPIVIQDIAIACNKLGCRFNMSTGNQSTASSKYLTMQVTIPANWGKTMYVDTLRAGSNAASVVDILSTALSGTGTTMSPINTNFGSSNKSAITGLYNTSAPSTTSSSFQTFIFNSGTYETNFNGRIIFTSKTTEQKYCISVHSESGTGNNMIGFSWWEL